MNIRNIVDIEKINSTKNNFEEFCKNVKLENPVKGLVPFELYPYQKRLIDFYEKNSFVLVKKFRQGGFSTTTLAYLLQKCITKENRNAIIVTKNKREAFAYNDITRNIIDNMPKWLKPKLKVRNDHQIQFDNGSNLFFMIANATRGIAADYLMLDEPAFWTKCEQHWKALYPCAKTGGKVFVVSTPNKKQGWFYKTYKDALENKNGFKIFETNYKDCPEFDNKEWVERMKINLGEKFFRQEVLAEFVDEKENEVEIEFKDGKKFAVIKLMIELKD